MRFGQQRNAACLCKEHGVQRTSNSLRGSFRPLLRNFKRGLAFTQDHGPNTKEKTMPIILWLLGVPISLILILMLTGVLHF